MSVKIRLAAFLFCAAAGIFHTHTAAAQESGPLPHAAELSAKLGWTPSEAVGWMGAPISIFALRGAAQNEDSVVFYYSDHIYLFWFQDRVWQVRADERWEGDLDGVKMGDSLETVTNLWGPPVNERDINPTWTLPDRGYPVRIRLYFDDANRLNDLYIYRSDW